LSGLRADRHDFNRANQAANATASPASRATPIVFVVDDDVSVRESLELLVRCAGWQAETFASAQEFLARPRVNAPSCLVLDVTLPDFNGLDLQKRVAVDRTDMPIISSPATATCNDGPSHEGGCVEFLTNHLGTTYW